MNEKLSYRQNGEKGNVRKMKKKEQTLSEREEINISGLQGHEKSGMCISTRHGNKKFTLKKNINFAKSPNGIVIGSTKKGEHI